MSGEPGIICGHCGGRVVGMASVDDVYLCHSERRDCYFDVTVRREVIGKPGVQREDRYDGPQGRILRLLDAAR